MTAKNQALRQIHPIRSSEQRIKGREGLDPFASFARP